MKRLRHITFYLALGLLGGCVADELQPSSGVEPGKGNGTEYYMNLHVSLPTEKGTRSETDEKGESGSTVDGTTKESTLYSASIYLCVDNKVKLELTTTSLSKQQSGDNYTLTARINNIEDLAALAGEDVQILIAGNSREASYFHNLSTTVDATDAVFDITGVDAMPIGDFGSEGHELPLVNSANNTFSFEEGESDEETLDNLLDMFTGEGEIDKYYSYTEPIKLERAVARIEFKDKTRPSSGIEEEEGGEDPEEEIGQLDDEGEPGEEGGSEDTAPSIEDLLKKDYHYQIGSSDYVIELKEMQVFNVNPQSYLFRQGAEGDKTKATEERDIFIVENGDASGETYNWIVTPDWDYNDAGDAGEYTKSDTKALLNPLQISDDGYKVTGNGGKITIDELKVREVSDEDGYHPWCYVSENTLPSTALMATADEEGNEIVAKYATGVAFKFAILDKDGNQMTTSTPEEKWRDGITKSQTEGHTDDGTITLTDSEGKYIDVTPEVEDDEEVDNGEDGEETEEGEGEVEEAEGGEEIDEDDENGEVNKEGKYYITYYGFIVHNNPQGYNPKEGNFAPMYYGVVRNNTYQLSINSIEHLPSPKEPDSYCLALEIRVLAWARRDITIQW